jgi:hypothetical protein
VRLEQFPMRLVEPEPVADDLVPPPYHAVSLEHAGKANPLEV